MIIILRAGDHWDIAQKSNPIAVIHMQRRMRPIRAASFMPCLVLGNISACERLTEEGRDALPSHARE
jgi:hypothetical protein